MVYSKMAGGALFGLRERKFLVDALRMRLTQMR